MTGTTTRHRRHAWPEDETSPLELHELVQPLADAILSAYELNRKDRDRDIPWTGPEGGGAETIGVFGNAEALTAEQLRYDEDEQGRNALWVILGIAVRLGCEEGRRIDRRLAEGPRPDPKLDAKVEELLEKAMARRKAELERHRMRNRPLPEHEVVYACAAGRCTPSRHALRKLRWCEGTGVSKAGWWCDDCRRMQHIPEGSTHETLGEELKIDERTKHDPPMAIPSAAGTKASENHVHRG